MSNSLGQVVQQYSYDAYGNAHGFAPDQALTNLLYSGEQFNPVSGLQYLRARWYNPTNGRFNRLDPYFGNHESPLSFHKYAYAHMNPVMGTDPSGLSYLSLAFGGAGGTAGYGQMAAMAARMAASMFSSSGLAAGATVVGASLLYSILKPMVMQITLTAAQTSIAADGPIDDLDTAALAAAIAAALALAKAQGITISVAPSKVFPVVQACYPEVYTHHYDVCQFPNGGNKTNNLNYLKDSAKTRKNRREAMAASAYPLPVFGKHRDEYPYASTSQGGRDASVRPLSPFDNIAHGVALRIFYMRYLSKGEAFFVLPVATPGVGSIPALMNP